MINAYDKERLEFQKLTNGLLSVTFKPYSSKLSKVKHYCLFEPHSIYCDVALRVMQGSDYWLEINWLCNFVRNHDKQIIPAI